jgi:replicative DNA helicase
MALKLLYLCFNLRIDKGFDADGKRIMDGPEVIIVTPFQSQISNIFQEMEALLKRNKSLANQVEKNNKGNLYTQTPFFSMQFANGANISGFVTGTAHKSDGSAGGTIRGDSADIVYLDEMDLIPDEILKKVVEPLLMTRTGVRMFGTSTPIGKRATFYRWSQERPDFKEFYYPSTSLPAWEEVKHEIVGNDSESNETFRAEILAEFIDGSYGVFKPSNIHGCRADYTYEQVGTESWYKEMGIRTRSNMVICMGIDWNKNAGSEFFVVGYDPESGMWFALDAVNITVAQFTFEAYKEEFLRLNFKWKPDYIYADAGYGHTVIEDLKLIAHRLKGKPNITNYELETIKILDRLKAFEFGGKVELRDPVTSQTITKPGKAFLVETAVRIFESQRFRYPENDIVLTKQLGNYVVLRTSEASGKPIYGPDNDKVGDHRLDAMMLSIGGIFIEQGIYARKLAGSTPAMLSRESEDLPPFLFNERTDGQVVKGDLIRKNSAAGAHLSVLEILRGNGREQDQAIRKGYAAKEYLDNPERGSRGNLTGPGAAPQPPPSAYARDEEDLWKAQQRWKQRKQNGSRTQGFPRRGR